MEASDWFSTVTWWSESGTRAKSSVGGWEEGGDRGWYARGLKVIDVSY